MKHNALPRCPRAHRTSDDLAHDLAELLDLGIFLSEDTPAIQESA